MYKQSKKSGITKSIAKWFSGAYKRSALEDAWYRKYIFDRGNFRAINNQKGTAIIAVLTIAIIANITFMVLFSRTKSNITRSGLRTTNTSALNIAEAGKEHLYAQVATGTYVPVLSTNDTVFSSQSFGNGNYSVSCSSNTNVDSLWIRSRGTRRGVTKTVNILAMMVNAMTIPTPPIKGAITARSNITVKGNITVDGRDHDGNGNLIGSGMYGVSTCTFLSLEGSATIGGNGVAPVDKSTYPSVATTVAEEGAAVTSSFSSPEEFLGLAPGSLDAYKTASTTFPMDGIVYITNDYGPVQFGNSTGILIVHNNATNAELHINNGTFKGIIIADKMDKINGNALIIGAVVTLIDGVVSTFGNGNAVIKYSSQVMANLEDYCNNLPQKVEEISWSEQ